MSLVADRFPIRNKQKRRHVADIIRVVNRSGAISLLGTVKKSLRKNAVGGSLSLFLI